MGIAIELMVAEGGKGTICCAVLSFLLAVFQYSKQEKSKKFFILQSN